MVNILKELNDGLKSATTKKDGTVFIQATISKKLFNQVANYENLQTTNNNESTPALREIVAEMELVAAGRRPDKYISTIDAIESWLPQLRTF